MFIGKVNLKERVKKLVMNETEDKEFNVVAKQWIDNNRFKMAQSTCEKYGQLYKNYIQPYFKQTTCRQLTEKYLENFRQSICYSRCHQGKLLSEGMQRTIIMLVNNALRDAYINRLTEKNLYIRPGLYKTKKPVKVISGRQQKQIEDYIYRHRDSYTLGIFMGLYTGLRLGELCALKWKDIDFCNPSICVKRTVQRLKSDSLGRTSLVVSRPKSISAFRIIPVPEFLINYLKPFRQDSSPEAYLLTNKCSIPMEPRTLQYNYKKMLQILDIPYINFHSLRHTFATRCVMLGWDMKTLSEVLGHADTKITMDYYFHSSFEFKKEQMKKLVLLSQN